MLASILVSVVSLIALQVLLVVKVADWLSAGAERPQNEGIRLIDRSAGRFTGLARS